MNYVFTDCMKEKLYFNESSLYKCVLKALPGTPVIIIDMESKTSGYIYYMGGKNIENLAGCQENEKYGRCYV